MVLNYYVKFEYLNTASSLEVAEKLYDHFEKVELKNRCDFNKLIKAYFKSMNDIIEPSIEKAKVQTRAQKYYEKAVEISKLKQLTFQDLLDYSRIVICLYIAIIKNRSVPISNFDLSLECLDLELILDNISKETVAAIGLKKRKDRFDLSDSYGMDVCVLLVFTLLLFKLKDGE